MNSASARIWVAISVVLTIGGCRQGSSQGHTPDPNLVGKDGSRMDQEVGTCRGLEDVHRLDRQRAAVIGTYVQVDVRQQQKPPPVFAGHAAVRLSDSTLVLLEPVWKKEAIRPSSEISRWEGRRVRVVGILYREAPEAPEPTANLLWPCLTPIESIETSE